MTPNMDMKPDGQQHISFIDSIRITKKDLQTPEDKKKKNHETTKPRPTTSLLLVTIITSWKLELFELRTPLDSSSYDAKWRLLHNMVPV